MVRRLDKLRFAGCPFRARFIGLWTVVASIVVLSALIGTRVGLAAPLGSLRVHAERPRAPEFVLHDVHGEELSLSAHRGKVVLVNFWSAWCPPCREEMPELQRLWSLLETSGQFALLAVGIGEDYHSTNLFYHSLPEPLTFTLLPDLANVVSRQWPLRGLPASFVLDRDGRIVFSAATAIRWSDPRVVDVLRHLIDETRSGAGQPPRAGSSGPEGG